MILLKPPPLLISNPGVNVCSLGHAEGVVIVLV